MTDMITVQVISRQVVLWAEETSNTVGPGSALYTADKRQATTSFPT